MIDSTTGKVCAFQPGDIIHFLTGSHTIIMASRPTGGSHDGSLQWQRDVPEKVISQPISREAARDLADLLADAAGGLMTRDLPPFEAMGVRTHSFQVISR